MTEQLVGELTLELPAEIVSPVVMADITGTTAEPVHVGVAVADVITGTATEDEVAGTVTTGIAAVVAQADTITGEVDC